MIKRILLFLLTNILVVMTLSLITNMLGLYGYIHQYGLDYQNLAIYCLIWGMGSSIASLWMSRWMARLFMNIKLIEPEHNTDIQERELLRKVYQLARKAGLNTMPQVGVYKSNELNAFATGPTKNRALVAVSSGLLRSMNPDEIEGVLGHEVSHIVNGDMVTMTLLQGIVNAFSLFLSHVIAYALSVAWNRSSSDQNNHRHHSRTVYYVSRFLLDIIITLLGSMVVAAFSRYREYRADKGGAALAGRYKMVAALEHLRSVTTQRELQQESFVTPFKITRRQNRIFSLLATHPDIELRIAALKR
jgi:heat shock protein HtpX